jgi:hypothetical protein
MAFTDNCSVFGGLHEEGINLFVQHIMRQRPSLFNYGTAYFLQHPDRLCRKIDMHPEVLRRHNPLITVEDPLPIPGTHGAVGMNFCLQLSRAEIDFHPGNVITLPPQLNPPLKEQAFALRAMFCAGLGCPGERELLQIEQLVDDTPFFNPSTGRDKESRDKPPRDPKLPPTPIPFRQLTCFCLEVMAVLHFERESSAFGPRLALKLDGLEIVDIKPDGLESTLECYVSTVLRVAVLPRVKFTLNTLVLEVGNYATIQPTPISPVVPFNPSVADDALSVFITVS